MKKFYERLSYSFGNEDSVIESKALSIKKDDVVVCITASGDRTLNLLTTDLNKIYSVDVNPIQNHLLALKMQAMSLLETEDYLNFLGASKEPYPIVFLDSIISSLPEDAQSFWNRNKHLIEDGVLYKGALEKLCQYISFGLNLFFKKQIQDLFDSSDVFEQQKFIKELFEKKTFKFLSKLILNPIISKKYFSDPGLYAYVEENLSARDYLIDLIKSYLTIHPVIENPLLHLIFKGKVSPEAFPPYLKKELIPKIKQRLSKIEIVHEDMIDFLENLSPSSVDCFSLSDIASYMDEKSFNRLIKAMIRCAKPGARFCIRELMSRHKIDAENLKKINLNEELADELKIMDKCFVYRFKVGNIL